MGVNVILLKPHCCDISVPIHCNNVEKEKWYHQYCFDLANSIKKWLSHICIVILLWYIFKCIMFACHGVLLMEWCYSSWVAYMSTKKNVQTFCWLDLTNFHRNSLEIICSFILVSNRWVCARLQYLQWRYCSLAITLRNDLLHRIYQQNHASALDEGDMIDSPMEKWWLFLVLFVIIVKWPEWELSKLFED